MFLSCISNSPVIDQRKQFAMVAKVNGSGMLLADFVFKTVLRAARGEPNSAMQNTTAACPIIAAGSLNGDM
jgi:hypothetical protein